MPALTKISSSESITRVGCVPLPRDTKKPAFMVRIGRKLENVRKRVLCMTILEVGIIPFFYTRVILAESTACVNLSGKERKP
jgi:hypothetical protein